MGHYVFADTYSAEIKKFVKASSTPVKYTVEFVIAGQILDHDHFLLFQHAQPRQRKFANYPLKRTCNPLRTRWTNFLAKVRLFFKSNETDEG